VIPYDALAEALTDYVPRQRWFARFEVDVDRVEVTGLDVIRKEWPLLVRVLADVSAEGDRATYQVLLGLRPPGGREQFLEGKPEAVIGELPTEIGPGFAYDAIIDPELAIALLEYVAPGQDASRARLMSGEQTNSSVVYDERLILKVFRRLAPGPNPDAEITRALTSVGFDHVAPPIAEWRGEDTDYAVVNEFLVGAADGFHLALTSLRDLYDRRCDPAEAGGDFAPEARRLGDITGRMHVALAEAFGTSPADGAAWLADMRAQLDRAGDVGLPRDRIHEIYNRVGDLDDLGPAVRIHGDFHLGQVVRTDAGWYVLDFEGEPARPLEERRRPSSAMKDVAGMLRSFDYATQVALTEWGEEADEELRGLALAWQHRNGHSFLEGYLGAKGVEQVLPGTDEARLLLLAAFELDKAVYEVAYERAHRPEWIDIPLSATRRILEGAS